MNLSIIRCPPVFGLPVVSIVEPSKGCTLSSAARFERLCFGNSNLPALPALAHRWRVSSNVVVGDWGVAIVRSRVSFTQ